jgi:hypothetical protein
VHRAAAPKARPPKVPKAVHVTSDNNDTSKNTTPVAPFDSPSAADPCTAPPSAPCPDSPELPSTSSELHPTAPALLASAPVTGKAPSLLCSELDSEGTSEDDCSAPASLYSRSGSGLSDASAADLFHSPASPVPCLEPSEGLTAPGVAAAAQVVQGASPASCNSDSEEAADGVVVVRVAPKGEHPTRSAAAWSSLPCHPRTSPCSLLTPSSLHTCLPSLPW